MANIEYVKQLITLIINSEFNVHNVQELVNLYRINQEIEREIIRKEIANTNCGLKMLAISETFSELAYNEQKEVYIQVALTLQSIEDFRWDPRENIIYLSIIWHVILYLNVDKTKLFKDIIEISSNKAALYLKEFYDRSPEMKSIKTMGLKAIIKNCKTKFEMNTPPWIRS